MSSSRTLGRLFLDRDGVIVQNIARKNRGPRTLEEMRFAPGIPALARFVEAHDLVLTVVTNQPDLSRGLLHRVDEQKVEAAVLSALPLGTTYYRCEHVAEELCHCRKPAPGLLEKANFDRDVGLDRTLILGDQCSDIEAGARFGIAGILLDGGNRCPDECDHEFKSSPLSEVESLHAAIPILEAFFTP